MKITINSYDFRRAFFDANRGNNFSYEALVLLFDYLEELENNIGVEDELDVVAICCDYEEDSIENIISNYSIDVEGLSPEEAAQTAREYLAENTTLIGETSSGYVYTTF